MWKICFVFLSETIFSLGHLVGCAWLWPLCSFVCFNINQTFTVCVVTDQILSLWICFATEFFKKSLFCHVDWSKFTLQFSLHLKTTTWWNDLFRLMCRSCRWSPIFLLYFFLASLFFPNWISFFLSFFESQLAECNLHLMICWIVQLEESLDAFYC